MTSDIRKYKELPDIARPVAQALQRQGFGEGRWVYVDNARLADPRLNLQIRDMKTQANPTKVREYAGGMSAPENNFPPVILTKDAYLVDGITRTTAAARIGRTSFPAFILDVNYADAPTAIQKQLRELGAYMNLLNGVTLSKQERIKLILSLAREDDSPTDLWTRLGGAVHKTTIGNVLNADKARRRAEKLGVDLNETRVTQSHLTTLGGNVASVNDEPFREFVLLIRDAALSTKETGELAKRIMELGSDQQKLDLIEAERKSTGVSGNGTRSKPPASRELRKHMGWVKKFDDDPGDLVETSKEAAESHLKDILDTVSILRRVANEQMDLNNQME